MTIENEGDVMTERKQYQSTTIFKKGGHLL